MIEFTRKNGANTLSYDLCVWDSARNPTLPTNDDEACEIMERLSKVADSMNPVFEEFSSALVQLHQASLEGKPDDMKAFWGSDPRESAAKCNTAVLRLRLPTEADIKQFACVVQAAAKRGLVVYDDELSMVFLPDGTIYPESLREGWKADLEELMAGPEDPSLKKPDNRSLLQTIAMELFDAIGRGEKRIY
ncbi:MAG: hypothetical protein ABI824_04965 [Acidobacteriota bacterium]